MTVARAMPQYVRREPYFRLVALLALLTAATGTLIDFLFKATVAARIAPERIPRPGRQRLPGPERPRPGGGAGPGGSAPQERRHPHPAPPPAGRAGLGDRVPGGRRALALPGPQGPRRRAPPLPQPGGDRAALHPGLPGQAPAAEALHRHPRPARGTDAGLGAPPRSCRSSPSGTQIAAATLCLALVSVAWVQATLVLRRRYLERFQRELGEGRVTAASIGRLDLASAEVLVAGLGSSSVREVLAALDVLAGSRAPGPRSGAHPLPSGPARGALGAPPPLPVAAARRGRAPSFPAPQP